MGSDTPSIMSGVTTDRARVVPSIWDVIVGRLLQGAGATTPLGRIPDLVQSVINFEALAEAGTINRDDLNLFEFADSAEEAWDVLVAHDIMNGPKQG